MNVREIRHLAQVFKASECEHFLLFAKPLVLHDTLHSLFEGYLMSPSLYNNEMKNNISTFRFQGCAGMRDIRLEAQRVNSLYHFPLLPHSQATLSWRIDEDTTWDREEDCESGAKVCIGQGRANLRSPCEGSESCPVQWDGLPRSSD